MVDIVNKALGVKQVVSSLESTSFYSRAWGYPSRFSIVIVPSRLYNSNCTDLFRMGLRMVYSLNTMLEFVCDKTSFSRSLWCEFCLYSSPDEILKVWLKFRRKIKIASCDTVNFIPISWLPSRPQLTDKWVVLFRSHLSVTSISKKWIKKNLK